MARLFPGRLPVGSLLLTAGLLKVLLALTLFLGTGFEAPAARATAASAGEPETTQTAAPPTQDVTEPETDIPCRPEALEILRARLQGLKEREAALEKQAQDLEALRQEIEQRLQLLKRLEAKLDGPVKKAQAENEARIQHIAGVYSSMDPPRAAALLDKMDEATVAQLFGGMKSKKVAQILALMDPEKAARISSTLSHQGLDPGGTP